MYKFINIYIHIYAFFMDSCTQIILILKWQTDTEMLHFPNKTETPSNIDHFDGINTKKLRTNKLCKQQHNSRQQLVHLIWIFMKEKFGSYIYSHSSKILALSLVVCKNFSIFWKQWMLMLLSMVEPKLQEPKLCHRLRGAK